MNGWAGLTWATLWGLLAGLIVRRMIVRLPVGRSFFWPLRDRCESCFSPLPLAAPIPILGTLLCRKCPHCNHPFPWRASIEQGITLVLILALYFLYSRPGGYPFPWYSLPYYDEHLRALFVYHSILAILLAGATFVDFDWMIIPDSITVTGMILGVLLGTFWYVELHPVPLWLPTDDLAREFISCDRVESILGGSELSPTVEYFRNAVNDHYRQHWNRWLGFLTSVVGLIAGGAIVWVVRGITSWIFQVEAIGFGDVTLMAMVGAFLGWQTVVMAFFLAPISAVVVGIAVWIITGNRAIPYGPHLSIASLACVFAWREIWGRMAELFNELGILAFMAGLMVVCLVLSATLIQGVKLLFRKLLAESV